MHVTQQEATKEKIFTNYFPAAEVHATEIDIVICGTTTSVIMALTDEDCATQTLLYFHH